MKNIKSIILLLFIGLTVFTSCKDDEFDGIDTTSSPIILGWADAAVTESYFEDLGTLENTYPLEVLGGGDGSPTSSDIEVTLSVDPSSTAVDGEEYSLPSTTFSIPAGQSFVNVPVNVNTGSFNPSTPTKLVLNVQTSTSDITVSGLAKQMTITFVGCLSTIADHTYDVTITRRNTGGSVTRTGVTFSEVGVNMFQTAYVGAWPLTPGARFSDICGDLFIQSHDLADTYSNQVKGVAGADNLAGSVDEDGNFTLVYEISGESSVSGPWGIYDAVYTKQ